MASLVNRVHTPPNDFGLISREVPSYDDYHAPERRYIQQRPLQSLSVLSQTSLANDLISGQNEDTQLIPSNQCFAPRSPSPSSLNSGSGNTESVGSQVQYDEVVPELREDRVAKGENPHIDWSKGLLSPIKFSPQRIEKNTQPSRSQARLNPTQFSSEPRNERARYVFYPPKNPSDRPSHIYDCHRSVPRRRLSYGEPLTLAKPRL